MYLLFPYIYAFSRTHKEVEKLLLNEVKAHENFVFAAVKGDYGEDILPFYQYVVIIEGPKNIRLQRVNNRSFQKFGNRMLLGGNLYKQEKEFMDMVKSRTENDGEEWVHSLICAIIRVDGTKSIKANTDFFIEQLKS